jgi:hypothetical protein
MAAATLALFLGVTGQANAEYIFTTIDVPFAGVLETRANGINTGGQIVGFYRTADRHGFLDSGGMFSPIDASFAGSRRSHGWAAKGQKRQHSVFQADRGAEADNHALDHARHERPRPLPPVIRPV